MISNRTYYSLTVFRVIKSVVKAEKSGGKVTKAAQKVRLLPLRYT